MICRYTLSCFLLLSLSLSRFRHFKVTQCRTTLKLRAINVGLISQIRCFVQNRLTQKGLMSYVSPGKIPQIGLFRKEIEGKSPVVDS